MKKQHIAILAVLVVALLAVRLLLSHRGTEVAADLKDAGVSPLLATPLDPAQVKWIRISGPASSPGASGATAPAAAEPPPLALERTDAGWIVTSAQGVPADAAQVDAFVKRAAELSGEVRGEGASSYAGFGLAPDKAVEVEMGPEPGKPQVTLWLGKQGDDPGSHFVRSEGSEQVRHVREGLRSLLALRGEADAPAADLWVNKVVYQAEPKDLTQVVIEKPDFRMVLQKQPAASGASAQGSPAATKWTVSSPALSWPVQEDSLDGVVSRAAGGVRVDAVLDATLPACTAPALATATFTREGGAATAVRIGPHLNDRDDVALQVGDSPYCYAYAARSVPTVLPRASAVWTVPAPFAGFTPASEPTKVNVQQGADVTKLTRGSGKDATWSFDAPRKGIVSVGRVTRLVSALRNLRVDDVADSARLSPDAMKQSAHVGMELEGKTVGVRMLGERPGGLGERYVQVEGGLAMPPGLVAVISKSTAEALLPRPEELVAKGE